MKRFISIFLCFAMIFSCAACTIDMNTEGGHNGSPSMVTPEPFVRLESFGTDGEIISVCDAGNNKVAVISMWDNPRGSSIYSTNYKLYIVDIEQGKVLVEKDIGGSDTMLGIRKNGEYVMLDYSQMNLSIYNKDFNLVKTRVMPEGSYSFDKDEDCLYNNNSGTLKRIDFEGNEEIIVSFKKDASIETFDIKNGLLIVTGPGINETIDTEYSVYSLKEKRILYAGYTENSTYNIINDSILIQNLNPITNDEDEEDDDEIYWQYTVTGYEQYTGQELYSYEVPENAPFYCFDNTEFAVSINDIYEDGVKQETKLLITNFKDGKVTELDSDFKYILYYDVRYISKSNKFVLGIAEIDDNDKISSYICVVSPEVIKLKDDLIQYKKEEKTEKVYTLGKHLKSARKMANECENKFNVRILIGNECLNAASSTYTIISTENEKYSTDRDRESEIVKDFLTMLSSELEKYSFSFFETFKNYKDEGGLRILIVEELVNTEGDFEAAGVHYTNNAWYNIVLDYDKIDEASIHHEIWHAVESRIDTDNHNAFINDDWAELNPKGFEYSWDFDHYTEIESYDKHILSFSDNIYDDIYDNIYFIELYSIVTEKEDRATLIEKLYAGHYDYNGYDYDYYDNSYDYVYSYPHLKAKLDYMAKYVKEVFGDVYWITWFSKADR